MSPRYRDGDYLLVGRYRFRQPRPGDDIVFQHADLGSLVKRVDKVESGCIRVSGLNTLSTEPTALGPIPAASAQSLERVLLHFPS